MAKREWTSTEKQGNGRAWWFRTRAAARSFIKDRQARGWTLGIGPEDPAGDWYVWMTKQTKSRQTADVLGGIDPASGFWG